MTKDGYAQGFKGEQADDWRPNRTSVVDPFLNPRAAATPKLLSRAQSAIRPPVALWLTCIPLNFDRFTADLHDQFSRTPNRGGLFRADLNQLASITSYQSNPIAPSTKHQVWPPPARDHECEHTSRWFSAALRQNL